MSGEVKICNQALGRLGGTVIMDLQENTREAQLCRSFFDNVRKIILTEFKWTFATKRYVLLPVVEKFQEDAYDYRFRIPAEVLNVWTVFDDPDPDRHTNGLDWQVEGEYIVANADKIYVKASVDLLLLDHINPQFINVFAIRLAAEMCNALTGNNTLHTALMQEYVGLVRDAAMADGQQGRTQRIRSPRYVDVRRR